MIQFFNIAKKVQFLTFPHQTKNIFKTMSAARTLRSTASIKTEAPSEEASKINVPKMTSQSKKNLKSKPIKKETEDDKILVQPEQQITVKVEVCSDDEILVQPEQQITVKVEVCSDDESLVQPEQQITVKVEVCSDDESNPLDFKDITPEASKIKKDKSVSPRKRKSKTETASVKTEKILKLETGHLTSCDIEDAIWEPDNWSEVLDNILKMRKLHIAPVDTLGCKECPDKDANPEVFRYQTLISVMLSSQTRDEATHAATQRLIEHGLTVDSVLETSDEKIGELIYPVGFWKSKVKYIKRTTEILKDDYSGDIPRTFKDLCKLPGVGPKMANIVMSVAWNDTVGIAVDTHVHRISNRLGWVPKPTKDPEHTRKALESWLPKDLWRPINATLDGFGRDICKPVGPSCEMCLNSNICPVGRSSIGGKSKVNLDKFRITK